MNFETNIEKSILYDREKRAEIITKYIGENELVVVTANTPGLNKKTSEARFLVRYFKNHIKSLGVKAVFEAENLDGPFFIGTHFEGKSLKEKTINIEESHPLGRLIDIDVYNIKGIPISRDDLGYKARTCLLCENNARHCVRDALHLPQDIIVEIKNKISLFIEERMQSIFDRAITMEARLHPKFGLVTEMSKGSHHDMVFALLMRAKEAILPYFTKILKAGYFYSNSVALKKARAFGLEAEAAMYKVTDGINAYKGMIFIIGFLALAIGNCFRDYSFDLFYRIAYFGRGLMEEFIDSSTFGKQAFQKYNISGARGEVHRGLPHVQSVLPLLHNYEDDTLTMALLYLMTHIEDTVFLKRAKSLKCYKEYLNILSTVTTYDKNKIEEVSAYCIKHNLSFGGSADLLVAALCIKMTEEEFNYRYE